MKVPFYPKTDSMDIDMSEKEYEAWFNRMDSPDRGLCLAQEDQRIVYGYKKDGASMPFSESVTTTYYWLFPGPFLVRVMVKDEQKD